MHHCDEMSVKQNIFSFLGIKAVAINGNTHKEVTRKPSDGTSHVSQRKVMKYANSLMILSLN